MIQTTYTINDGQEERTTTNPREAEICARAGHHVTAYTDEA